jgi:hypothetical protein
MFWQREINFKITSLIKQKPPQFLRGFLVSMEGLEPATNGLKVLSNKRISLLILFEAYNA